MLLAPGFKATWMNSANSIYSCHHELIYMSTHKHFSLLPQQYLHHWPNHFNDSFFNAHHFAHFRYRYGCFMQYSTEEFVVSRHHAFIGFQTVSFFVDTADVLSTFLIVDLVLHDLTDARSRHPTEILNNVTFQRCKMITNLSRHRVIEVQEWLECPPKVKCFYLDRLEDIDEINILIWLETV